MKYTIESESEAIHATVRNPDGSRRAIKIARLLHLPNASRRTAAMFGRHAENTWEQQPEYATFSSRPGSPVLAWNGKVIDIETKEDIYAHQIGTIHHNSIFTNEGQVAQVIALELENINEK